MRERVVLVGLDFGSTTSSMMVASARVLKNCTTGRMELGELTPLFSPDPVFTPFTGERLDLNQIEKQLDEWLASYQLADGVAGGGALITGLAAQQENAPGLVALVRSRIGTAVVATADDPRRESWLAFMGSCAPLTLAEPERDFLNLDIGGGTTNPALGNNGEVRSTGCLWVGARHIQVEPGSYRITAVSPIGRLLLDHLDIKWTIGTFLSSDEVRRITDTLVQILEAALEPGPPPVPAFIQVSLELPNHCDPVITFSGGVGELIYRAHAGLPLPNITSYGDLGLDLAQAILRSKRLSRHLAEYVPRHRGRATLFGLTTYSTEVSGATLYLKRPQLLPLLDLPILRTLGPTITETDLTSTLVRIGETAAGGCIQLVLPDTALTTIQATGRAIASAIRALPTPLTRPIVLFTTGNIGQTLGSYATHWGQLPVDLIVLDELHPRGAHFATLGRPHQGIVPVTFHRMG